MKELATKIINFAKEHRACDKTLTPALEAYEAGEYETVLATARGIIKWLRNNGFIIPDALLNGRVVRWHDNGRLAKEGTYKNGVFEGVYREWHENGQLARECNYINEVLEGLFRRWHDNGQLARECRYINGGLEGLARDWHKNGTLWSECNYLFGKLHGLSRRWQENGQLAGKLNYINGCIDLSYVDGECIMERTTHVARCFTNNSGLAGVVFHGNTVLCEWEKGFDGAWRCYGAEGNLEHTILQMNFNDASACAMEVFRWVTEYVRGMGYRVSLFNAYLNFFGECDTDKMGRITSQ